MKLKGFDESGYCNKCGTHYENVHVASGCKSCRLIKRYNLGKEGEDET